MVRGVFQPNKTRDITGQKFGSLTAVRFDHRDEPVEADCRECWLGWLKEEAAQNE